MENVKIGKMGQVERNWMENVKIGKNGTDGKKLDRKFGNWQIFGHSSRRTSTL